MVVVTEGQQHQQQEEEEEEQEVAEEMVVEPLELQGLLEEEAVAAAGAEVVIHRCREGVDVAAIKVKLLYVVG